MLTRIEQDDFQALLAQFVGERSSACTGADYYHDRVVIRVIFRHRSPSLQAGLGLADSGGSGSHARSLKPL